MSKLPRRSATRSVAKISSSAGGWQGPTSPATLIEAVGDAIELDILSEVHPPNANLRIAALSERHNVSISTIREALTRLAGRGLVAAEGQRGFRAMPSSLDDFRDMAQMRMHLETWAISEALRRGDDKWETGVVAAYHLLDHLEKKLLSIDRPLSIEEHAEWGIAHRRFHFAITSACGSEWALGFLGRLYDHSRRYRIKFSAFSEPQRGTQMNLEHGKLFQAAMQRDIPAACACITEHICNNRYDVVSRATELVDQV